MHVLVNGIGNIGTTIVNLLADYKILLGITTLYAKKRTINSWNVEELIVLQQKGIIVCCNQADSEKFSAYLTDYVIYEDIAQQLDYIFDTTANNVGNINKAEYLQLPHLQGVSAQGSEKGFGIPFMSGVNERKIVAERFVQIVSCNTHASLSVLRTLCHAELSDLANCDFVVVRRCEDLESHQRLVSASVVARHLDDHIGTHHAIDALDLLKTIGLAPSITSSDVTTPSQLLHSFRFNLTLTRPVTQAFIAQRLQQTPLIATTQKFDSNKVFEFGRKYSRYGRLYAQAIFVENNIMVKNNQIMGWAFIPQEGNTILSTLHAFLLQTNQPDAQAIIDKIAHELVLTKV